MAFANLKPVGFTNVDIRDGFWKQRIYAVNTVTSWSCIDQCEKTHRIDNFRRAGGLQKDGRLPLLRCGQHDQCLQSRYSGFCG